MATIFGKIIRGEIPTELVYESENLIAFRDIQPQAPVHILIVPKKEIEGLQSIESKDLGILSEVALCAQKLARELGIQEGYRLVTNNGAEAGQSVFHLHFHLIGGKKLSDTLG